METTHTDLCDECGERFPVDELTDFEPPDRETSRVCDRCFADLEMEL